MDENKHDEIMIYTDNNMKTKEQTVNICVEKQMTNYINEHCQKKYSGDNNSIKTDFIDVTRHIKTKNASEGKEIALYVGIKRIFVDWRRENGASVLGGSRGKGAGHIWGSLLILIVITLVLINDMVTYGHFNDKKRSVVVSTPPIQVVVYYEALCPDSRDFIMEQLVPAYAKLHSIMTISFVPYGKAQTTEKDGHYTFSCQHGPVECRANTVHACVTSVVKDEAQQLAIINCMIDKNDQPIKAGQKCVEKYKESWSAVAQCVDSDKGASILSHMGDMTHSLRPKVYYIPTIEIDGSLSEQVEIRKNLSKVLCRRYTGVKPDGC